MVQAAPDVSRWPGAGGALGRLVATLVLLLPLHGCIDSDETRLDKVKAARELVVVGRAGPTAYVETADGPVGFEYDLAKAFADSLRVTLRYVVVERDSERLPLIEKGDADMALAIATSTSAPGLVFTPAYHQVREQVVTRHGAAPLRGVADLVGRQLEVAGGTLHAASLRELREQHPELKWAEIDGTDDAALLELVWNGLLEVTVADSHVISLNRQFFPELHVAFDLTPPRENSWAFVASEDTSLRDAASQFLARYRASGELGWLHDRYYGPAAHANPINTRVYHARIANRLPLYRELFEQAGQETQLDWRLIAALSYQESYWDPKAVSPTGVRGIMMLTNAAAREVDVTDPFDPVQSIPGGARYLAKLHQRLTHIPAPDRTWFALAAYNVGFLHLEDARILTQRHRKDPGKWSEVKNYLPLLEQPQWYSRTRYGFARGREPVQFVNRVRTYYDILVKLDDDERARARTDALDLKMPAI